MELSWDIWQGLRVSTPRGAQCLAKGHSSRGSGLFTRRPETRSSGKLITQWNLNWRLENVQAFMGWSTDVSAVKSTFTFHLLWKPFLFMSWTQYHPPIKRKEMIHPFPPTSAVFTGTLCSVLSSPQPSRQTEMSLFATMKYSELRLQGGGESLMKFTFIYLCVCVFRRCWWSCWRSALMASGRRSAMNSSLMSTGSSFPSMNSAGTLR